MLALPRNASFAFAARRCALALSGLQKPAWSSNVSLSARAAFRKMCQARPAATMFSESELSLQESVSTFAKEILGPKVSEMDKKSEFDPAILKGCFEQGIMGIEAPEEYGGVGLGFTAACIAVEEIARIDPSLAVMIDIHNTLNVAALMKYGTPDQKAQYLPRLCTDTVSRLVYVNTPSTFRFARIRPLIVRDETHTESFMQFLSIRGWERLGRVRT
jgi:hypothetical protein